MPSYSSPDDAPWQQEKRFRGNAAIAPKELRLRVKTDVYTNEL
jgi:hypothetical protein